MVFSCLALGFTFLHHA